MERQYAEFASKFNITHLMARYPLAAIKDGPEISTRPEDYLDEQTKILASSGKLIYSYSLIMDFDRVIRKMGFKGKSFDDSWKELFLTWMENWLKTLADNGIKPDRYIIQLEDEPHAKRFPLIVEQAKFIKKNFPQLTLMVDVASWNTQEELNALAPYIDLWIPNERRLTHRDTGAKELEFYKKQGDFWTYLCSIRADVQSLLEYYRYRGIRNWMLGSKGIALFAFNSWRGDPWAQWDVVRSKGGGFYDECLVYNASNGPVPSLRLMEFRQGIEDFALLEMLQKKRKLKTRDELIEQLKNTQLDLNGILESTNPESICQWRKRIIEALGK